MLFYRKYKNNNSHSKGYGKWYARAIVTETIGIEAIATKMQDNCTVKRADILAVLSELGPTLKDLLQESKRVHIPYLGYLKLGISTIGEADTDQFTSRQNVKSVHVLFQAEKRTTNGIRLNTLTDGVVVSEVPDRETGKKSDGNSSASTGNDDGETGRP